MIKAPKSAHWRKATKSDCSVLITVDSWLLLVASMQTSFTNLASGPSFDTLQAGGWQADVDIDEVSGFEILHGW